MKVTRRTYADGSETTSFTEKGFGIQVVKHGAELVEAKDAEMDAKSLRELNRSVIAEFKNKHDTIKEDTKGAEKVEKEEKNAKTNIKE